MVPPVQRQPLPLRFVSSTTRGPYSPQGACKHEVPHARGVPRLICFDSCEPATQRSYPLLVLSTHGPCDQHGGFFWGDGCDLFALCCVCCSFKVCGFPCSHLVGKPVRKVCWESCAHGVPAHGQTDTAEFTCHWTGAWPQNKGLMHIGLLKALLLRAPL